MQYPEDYINKIICGDCLEVMKGVPDGSIDMILCDLPYGTTACKWDTVIPFEPLWEQYKRIIKDNGAIVLFGSEPFSSYLRISKIKDFKYDWIWNKRKAGNIFLAKYQPMKTHEIISVFNAKNYHPIKTLRDKIKQSKNYGTGQSMGGDGSKEDKLYTYTDKNPISILDFSNASQKGKFHPTQKPVALFEYLIKTYTNENDIVLDNCIGSGTTAVACIKTKRNFIGIEQDAKYCEIAQRRLAQKYIEFT
jgi:site-specific DNA-methyltransferase (adenine-specific)